MSDIAGLVIPWYDVHARDLPWRGSHVSDWGVLVSEVMLQQTPVTRVLPAYTAWMRRWPAPAALAAASPGDAVREWGRLGYPRRALRLHAAACVIVDRHDGRVPADLDALLALPGVGSYTARAVASFAFGQRHAVVDTNVRRVVARAVDGVATAGPPAAAGDLRALDPWIPAERGRAAVFAVAMMELGALVCTARAPRCETCPLAERCAWRGAGSPAYDGPHRRAQPWAGTDRQARGRLMAVLRAADGPVPASRLAAEWEEPVQVARALDGLVADGLVQRTGAGFALPG
ncbi:MAG TPA: A/G-specific adenine glycosylase [Mycobacteriales bacterium]|nr:A/G-specific adenine glycosylase [Mycobacteriales bacterium]